MSSKVTDKIAIVIRQGTRKAVFFMTYFVGIDIAKFEHVVSILDSITGELIIDSFHFDNSTKGFNELLSLLSQLNKDEIVVGFESTAHYHQTLFNYLTRNHLKCYLINPLMISRFRSISLRDAKNDNIDSKTISQFLLLEHKHLLNEDFESNDLKELCFQRDFVIKEKATLKIKLVSYLDRVFPELMQVIPQGTLYSKGVLAILKSFPTAYSIKNVRIDHLINIAKKASCNRYKESNVRNIKEAAKTSIGLNSAALALKIKQAIEMIEILEKQTDDLNQAITNHHLVINSPLHQIKGINSIEIGYIMSAIISIKRFDSPGKIIAYAGLDPKVRQSGTWFARNTRMSKRGNSLLRYALIWAANNIRKHPSKMMDYYNKKRSEHKSHYNALGHCATKLVRYIFWILNNPDKEFVN